MDDIIIRPIRQSDVDHFAREGVRYPSVQGWTVEKNGQLIAIAGVAYSAGPVIAFSHVVEGVELGKVTTYKTALKLWEKITGIGHKVLYAIADQDIPTASDFLKHLGFQYVDNRNGVEIFAWQTR